ncbi:MAG: ATP-binding cassette domain-containing protein, partial [Roseicyclus sp.]
AQLADRVVVMRRGELVEEGPVERIFADPQAEYTKALLASVPKLGEMRGKPAPEPLRIPGAPVPAAPTRKVEPPAKGRPLLRVSNLTVRFPIRGGVLRKVVANVHAVEGVGFDLGHAETLALVGESGCGKSTTARAILRLVEPTAGDILMDGQDIRGLNHGGLRLARRNMQMVFQDPFASLNPFMRLRKQVAEPMMNFALARGSEMEDRIAFLFDRVGLPRDFMRRFPHELSGGQRQRVAIARALSVNPKLIIADEAVSALDVSVQAQVLNLLMELQADFGLSYLFISHDMAVVERVSHRVGVMYLGRLVEIGSRADIFEDPRHAYTRTLMSGVPIADPTRRMLRETAEFKPLPSPIFPAGHEPGASVYREVSPGHFVLEEQGG